MKADAWNESELAVLEANRDLTNPQIAALLPGRSEGAIKQQRSARGCGRTAGQPRKRWTEADYEYMRANPEMPDAEMAAVFGVRDGSVRQARKAAAIRKVYRCVKCSSILAVQGDYCTGHSIIARRRSQYMHKAKERGLRFALSYDEMHDLLGRPCAYCGGEGGGIDRIDSDKGYEAGNVNPCCWECNQMKNDTPLAEWVARMKQIIEHVGGAA